MASIILQSVYLQSDPEILREVIFAGNKGWKKNSLF